jgi:hypothetical protein
MDDSIQGSRHETRAHLILDHLFDQWLILGDVFTSVDPTIAAIALEEFDARLDEFLAEIDPRGLNREWFEFGRQILREELLKRVDASVSDPLPRSG